MKEVVPVCVDRFATGAHRAGRGGEKREAVRPTEGQDEGEVAKAILPDLTAGREKGEWDQAGKQAWEKGADVEGAKVEERVLAMFVVHMHHSA